MKRRDFITGALAAGTVSITNPATAQQQFVPIKDFIRIRFCSHKVRTRRNVHALLNANANHPIVTAYRTGVAAMKALPASNPNSWAYQANIHGTSLPVNQWPAGAPFSTCEHGSQFFLSWHRIYLYFFEKIVRKHSGNADFALPYWNYAKAGQAILPVAFRTPANNSNALFDSTRSNSVNSGNALAAGTVNDATALGKANFLGGGQFQSSLEGTPHGSVHVAIGGNMGGFNTAGRDPIFWLHHCNIDRLWEKWLALGNGHSNPIGDANWMSEASTFADENGNLISMVNSDILETASQLKYQYDDPRECIPIWILTANLSDLVRKISMEPKLKFILKKEWKIDLGRKVARLDFAESDEREKLSTFLRASSIGEAAKNGRIVLRFGSLMLKAPMNGYFEAKLLVGPEGRTEPVTLGNITTFGADEESQRSMMQSPKMKDRPHTMGVTTEFDITEVLVKAESRASSLAVELNWTSGVDGSDAVNKEAAPVFGEVSLAILPFEAR